MTEKQLYIRVKIITIAAVMLICSLLMYILIQFITLSNLNAAKERLQNELEVLSKQTQTLEDEIANRNSRTYIEQYAREELGLGYDNENRYIINEE